MGKFLYPIYKLPLISYEKWWLYNSAKKRNGVLSDILTGTSLTLENSLPKRFNLLQLVGNTEQEQLEGKNLLDKTQITQATNKETITQLPTGFKIATINGWAGKLIINNLEQNTDYYLQYITTNINGSEKRVRVFAGTTTSTEITSFVNGTGGTFNTGNNTTINIWFYVAAASAGEVDFTDVMLTKGTTKTSYERYCGGIPAPNPAYEIPVKKVTGNSNIKIQNSDETEEQNLPLTLGNIELCKIDTAEDYFYKENGKWYLHKETNKVVLDGSENDWSLNETNTNTMRFVLNNIISDKKAFWYTKANIKNNSFQEYDGNSGIANIDTEGIAIRDDLSGFTVRALKSRVTDLNGFKTWLLTHNIIIYYKLQTPTNIEITDTTLINQLEEISKAKAYKGTTYIEGTSSDLEPIIKVQYWESEE